jgi:molybdate/tungstate transport system permease protein
MRPKIKTIEPFRMLQVLLGGLVILFIVSPLLNLFLQTSGMELFEAGNDWEVRESISRTLGISFATTIAFALAGVPFAYLLARRSFPAKKLVTALIDLPVVIPHSAAGIALLGFISRDTAIGQVADAVGIQFVGHSAGVAIAMAFVSIPFLVNAARDGFSAVPLRLEKAALSLGVSPMRVFLTISLPLAWKHILSGIIMMFGRGMSEFGAVVIIAYHPMITPVLIYERFTAFGLSYARPVSVIFIIICLLFFVGLRMLTLKSERKDA